MPSGPTSAFYPGSFDPLTNGHKDIVERALSVFDRIIIALAQNNSKSALFSLDERRKLVLETFDSERVEVVIFEGLMVHAAAQHGATAVLRGLRGVSDFEYEFQLATMNKTLSPGLETFFMMTEKHNFYVSSKLVREVASFGGDVSDVVPPHIAIALKRKYAK
jgi:pantetheine-phosphate adenylyltransferase